MGGGNIATALLSLGRNIIVARLVSVEDYGVASTFAIVISFIEMASYTGADRMIVQAPDGDGDRLQHTLHLLQIVRGVFGATIILISADFISRVFGVPEVAWAYRCLAVVPLLRGFAHLDIFRAQREMRFGPTIKVEAFALVVSTATVYPLFLWLGDYRVMLLAIISQQLLFVLGSHLISSSPFRLSWSSELVRRSLKFGLPLTGNSILMFGVFYGDRMMVGSVLGMAELAWFSAAFALVLVPSQVIGKTLDAFFLPQLSRRQKDPSAFARLHLVALEASIVAGVIVAFTFAVCGHYMIVIMYGTEYSPAGSIIVLLAVMQGVRVFRSGPSTVAVSRAETVIPMLANVVRLVLLPTCLIGIVAGGGIHAVLITGIAAELVGLLISIQLLRRRLALPIGPSMVPLWGGLAVLAWIAVGSLVLDAGANVPNLVSLVAVALAAVWLFMTMRHLWGWARELHSSDAF